jgi:hypothetical protein
MRGKTHALNADEGGHRILGILGGAVESIGVTAAGGGRKFEWMRILRLAGLRAISFDSKF